MDNDRMSDVGLKKQCRRMERIGQMQVNFIVLFAHLHSKQQFYD